MDSSETGTQGLLIGIAFTLLINFLMTGALGYLFIWINTLQLIIHLPMISIPVPPNVSAFFSIIIPIVTFDLISPEWSTELVLEFEEFPEPKFQENFAYKVFGQM